MFVCPGCIEMLGGTGLNMLPVNCTNKTLQWEWDKNLILPTLYPSILTRVGTEGVCHSFLRKGRFEFLDDCTHSLAGQTVEMPDLPYWIILETKGKRY